MERALSESTLMGLEAILFINRRINAAILKHSNLIISEKKKSNPEFSIYRNKSVISFQKLIRSESAREVMFILMSNERDWDTINTLTINKSPATKAGIANSLLEYNYKNTEKPVVDSIEYRSLINSEKIRIMVLRIIEALEYFGLADVHKVRTNYSVVRATNSLRDLLESVLQPISSLPRDDHPPS